MLELTIFVAGVLAGGGAAWLVYRPRIVRLGDLTDRDARGRFVKRGK